MAGHQICRPHRYLLRPLDPHPQQAPLHGHLCVGVRIFNRWAWYACVLCMVVGMNALGCPRSTEHTPGHAKMVKHQRTRLEDQGDSLSMWYGVL